MIVMRPLYLLTVSLATCAVSQPAFGQSDQGNGHVSEVHRTINQVNYHHAISRASSTSDNIPEDDSDIEPMILLDGKLQPSFWLHEREAFEHVTDQFPDLQDGGWYYGMLCFYPFEYDSKVDKIISFVMAETGGCMHTALVVGKYNETRRTFSGTTMHDVRRDVDLHGRKLWVARNVAWEPRPAKQKLLKLYQTTREKARNPKIPEYGEKWVKMVKGVYSLQLNCLTFTRRLFELIE
ncbi:hypothetical protein LZ30DRAFT_704135 [Colletotrichum cereale]|nr:hypothetical protein LZ30DRAFT_704135 [Colletotrichum cereale]